MEISYEKAAEILGKTAQLHFLIHLFNCIDEEDYLSGIAKATKLSHSSVSRVAAPLLESGVLLERRLGYVYLRKVGFTSHNTYIFCTF